MLTELFGTAWALPVSGIIFGLVGFAWALHATHRFDRKYGRPR